MSVVATGVSFVSGFLPGDHVAAPIPRPGRRPSPPRQEKGRIANPVSQTAKGSARVR